jgi:3-phosphoshikimate 1-carboxyvinyltransferase
VNLDLGEASELTPVVAALAACANGVSEITGVGHIRRHETDRIAAIITDLGLAGVKAEELPDGLRITGVGESGFRAAVLQAFGDHRMAQLAAILGLRSPGIGVDDIGATAKTMPDFPQRWAQMVNTGQTSGVRQ